MNKNGLKTILFFSLFLVLFSFRGYAAPTISYSWESPTDPATYSTEAVYRFNVTVCDDDGASNISVVLFEWNAEPNITVIENIIHGSTCLNFTTTKIDLPVNESGWDYKWYANNTGDKDATPLPDNYTINKAPSGTYLYIDELRNSKTVDLNWTINFTISTNVSGRMVELWTNYSDGTWERWDNSTEPLVNYTKLTVNGVWNFTANFSGDTNYTGSNETFNITVTNLAPQYSDVSVNPDNDSQYAPNQLYQFNITWQDGSLNDVIFNIYNITNSSNISTDITLDSPDNFTITTIDSNTKVYTANIYDLPVENYSYSWNATDTFNEANSTGVLNYTVAKASTSVSLTISSGSWSITSSSEPVSVSFECNSAAPLNLTLYISDVEAKSGPSPQVDAALLNGGSHNCNCVMQGNDNYSSSSDPHTLTITIQGDDYTGPSPGGDDDYVAGKFTITDLASSLSVNAGESKTTTFKLKNTLNNDLLNVTISVTGIESSWYSISKVDKIRHGTSESVTITFNIPSDAGTKDYSVRVKAEGKTPLGSKKTASQKTLTLTVNPAEAVPETVGEAPEGNVTSNETSEEILTGLIPIRPEDMANIVLFFGFIACALIFIYRGKITNRLTGKYKRKPNKFKPLKFKSVKLKHQSFIKSLKRKLSKIKRKKFK